MSSADDAGDESGRASTRVVTAADRLRWLEQVAADPALSPTAFRIAFVLCSHVNRESGSARPSQPRLADKARASITAVKEALRTLVARGHLRSVVSVGRNHPSEHFPLLKTRRQADGFDDENGAPSRRFFEDEKGSLGRRVSDEKGSEKTVGQPPPNLLIEPMAGPTDQPTGSLRGGRARDAADLVDGSAPPPVVGADFAAFLAAFPTKTAPWTDQQIEAASVAFRAAVDAGADPLAIVEGAKRYATKRAAEIAAEGAGTIKYTSQPSVWLTRRDWLKGSPRQRKGGASAAPPGRGAKAASRPTVDEIIARWPPHLTEGKSREFLVSRAKTVLAIQNGE